MKMFFFGLLLVFSLGSCETMQSAERKNKMDFDLKLYGHEVRWGEIEALPSYLKPELVEEQAPLAHKPENIRVTEYELLVPPREIEEEPPRVAQTVRINYVFRDRQVVRTLVDKQLWEYDAAAKKWFRANPIPVFK
ncbi:hypothetical protein [Thiolapillus sp.]